MNIFFEEHQEVIKLLLKHEVDFLLVGGYAVVYHGYRRTTGDMDLWVRPSNENRDKLVNALSELGFEDEDLIVLGNMDFTAHQVFTLGSEPQKIDFLTKINQVSFEDANADKVIAEFENMLVPVINLNHLVLSKINSGRRKDEADVEELQKIQRKNK